ncbi:serine-type D-Ala-D-Ala carboxypeptidase [Clostridiales bacterium oral taxon 876 str. F0540]|nr:serine-type D-Ala-D-Ala carboxypeptidase [Clostridiales bacterium oral taxon 876 str. F0540]
MKRTAISFLLASLLVVANVGQVKAADNGMPKIQGKAGITMDIETGEIIYNSNIDEKEYPASTTKLMTALLFAENKNKNDEIKYTDSAKQQPEYSLDKNLHKMQIGESMSASDTMDALLLFSANDVAYMIGDNVSGNTQKFVELMNDRAKKLGLKNTHFVSPNGLHDPEHYTTSYDLSVIAREAFKNDWVRETMAKKNSKITTSTGTILLLENRNKLIGVDGCVGGKTGYTEPAGRALVAFYERNGRKMVGVVMKSVYDSKDSVVFEDMKKIIDWSYNAKQVELHKNGDTVKTETLSYKPFRFFGPEKKVDVPFVIHEDIKYYDNEINKKELKEDYNLDKINVWNLSSDKSVGTLNVKEREANRSFKLYSTVSTKDIVKQNIALYIGLGLAVIIIILGLLALILKIKNTRRRSSRTYY